MNFSPPPSLVDVLRRVHAFAQARGVACHIVGGWLRDQVLGRVPPSVNIDLVVPQHALAFAEALAAHLPGAFVPLDEAWGSARLVVTMPTGPCELDISDYRAPTLAEDLARRDFTVNAFAVALGDWLRSPGQPGPVVDPLRGGEALRQRRLQPCFDGTFAEDPVRILRGFRLAAQLGFALDAAALPLMRQAAPALAQVSGERIRDELLAIGATDAAAPAWRGLNDTGALDVLLPELIPGRGLDQGPFHHLDVLSHQLEAVAQADRFLADFAEFQAPLREPLRAYCAQMLVEKRPRKSLIKLAALIHDVGKPSSRQVHDDGDIWFIGHEHTGAALARPIVERLRLSNQEADMMCQLVLHHLRPGFLSREPEVTRRAVYRFYKELGDHGPACLLEWWADRMATRGTQSRLDQIDEQRRFLESMLENYFFKAAEVVKPPRLLDGNRLMQALQLKPGPLIGQLLEAIEEAQAEGHVATADEALTLARAQLKQGGHA